MLIAGGGGGTAWSTLTVQGMQNLIQNPDTERHYELLTGWKQSADLLVEHQWQVRNYRDNLAAAWPPEKNAASAAYIARLDELITNLTETYEAAISNHDAFAAATLSISLAQKDMDEIAREYQSNELLLTDFTAKQQNPSGQPTPTPSPSGEQPPVAPGRQQELYQKAVTLLSGVSADLAQAQVRIQTPRPYKPTGYEDDPGGGDGGGYVPPPIPPITPSFDSGPSPDGASARSPVTFPTSPNVSPPAAPQPLAPQPGLILGGATPTTTPVGPGSTPLAPTNPATPGLSPAGPGFFPSPPKSLNPSNGKTSVPPGSGPPRTNAGLPRDGFFRPAISTPGGAHVMPPGGMIGGAPGIGVAQPGSGRPATSHVNPVGGVIGGGTPQTKGAGTGATGSHTASGGMYGQPNGRSAGRRNDDNNTHWDPDNPWKTASGVDPVVMPQHEKRIDPGPAIGLN